MESLKQLLGNSEVLLLSGELINLQIAIGSYHGKFAEWAVKLEFKSHKEASKQR